MVCFRIVVVQSPSHVQLFVTLWTAACQSSLSFTISQNLLKLISVMPSKHIILSRPLLLLSVFPGIRIFSNELALHLRWPKYWCFSFSINPSNECSGLISFRIDWFDLHDLLVLEWWLNILGKGKMGWGKKTEDPKKKIFDETRFWRKLEEMGLRT